MLNTFLNLRSWNNVKANNKSDDRRMTNMYWFVHLTYSILAMEVESYEHLFVPLSHNDSTFIGVAIIDKLI